MTDEATQGPVKIDEILVDAVERNWARRGVRCETAADNSLKDGTFLGADPVGDDDICPEIVVVREAAEGDKRYMAIHGWGWAPRSGSPNQIAWPLLRKREGTLSC